MLVTHANIKGFGLTPLSEDRRGYMPPLLKTKKQRRLPQKGFKPNAHVGLIVRTKEGQATPDEGK